VKKEAKTGESQLKKGREGSGKLNVVVVSSLLAASN